MAKVNLSDNDIKVYNLLKRLALNVNPVSISQEKMASILSLSRQAISIRLARLIKLGYIKSEKESGAKIGKGNYNCYLVDTGWEPFKERVLVEQKRTIKYFRTERSLVKVTTKKEAV